ncbi:unnamed protein product [Rotaria socialis]|uniref:G domain-containing protein n=1 Tax=Rotaria socialis TaxID=392032 RepID=A0A820II53_9BILA|nr:unnamed protein product [Rotaria socialis]CAF4392440.1 unnamed protein product [Rotaria socialis]
MASLTKQKENEIAVVYKEKNGSQKIWHTLLCPYESAPWSILYTDMNQKKIADLGWRTIEYRNQNGGMSIFSGSGSNPPKEMLDLLSSYGELHKISKNSKELLCALLTDDFAVDHHTINSKTQKEIRICTLNNLNIHEQLGFGFHYHKQQRFHYILLTAHDHISLAQLSGLRNFDRIIEMNDKNVEDIVGWEQLQEQFCSLMNRNPNDPIKFTMLDPNSYNSYKQSNKTLSSFFSERIFVEPIQMNDLTATQSLHTISPTSVTLIRVLLMGGHAAGKSRIVDTLRNPCVPVYDYNKTSSTLRYDVRIDDFNNLRIYDTPGFKNDTDQDTIQNFVYPILQDCDNQLNVVCFVSHPRKVENHIKALNTAMKVLGSTCSSISMLILTHADKFKTNSMDEMRDKIINDPAVKHLLDFCHLGIYYSGAVNHDEVDESGDEKELNRRLKLIEPIRRLLIQKFRQCANQNACTRAPTTKFMVPESKSTQSENHRIPTNQCSTNQQKHQNTSKETKTTQLKSSLIW